MASVVQKMQDDSAYKQHLQQFIDNLKNRGSLVSTSIKSVDDAIGGLGGLTVLGGGPGTGKTALATQIALHHTAKGGGCIYLGFEEGAQGFLSKLLQRETGISRAGQAKAMQGLFDSITPKEIESLLDAALRDRQGLILRSLPEGGEGLDVDELKQRVESLRRDTNESGERENPVLVVVDSLHYTPLGLDSANLDGKRAIDAALHIFSDVQQKTGACVLMIAHQTKGEARNRDTGLMAFSGSATIAYAVDQAIQLSRTTDDQGSNEAADEEGNVILSITIPKNRLGASWTSPIQAEFNLSTQRIK